MMQLQSEKLDFLLEKAKKDDGLSVEGSGGGERQAADQALTIAHLPSEDERGSGLPTGAPDLASDLVARPPKSSLPLFCGPTSSSFCINVVGMSLNETEGNLADVASTRGSETLSILDGEIVVDRGSEIAERESTDLGLYTSSIVVTASCNGLPLHPLEEVDAETAIHLVQIYDDLVGVIHPFINVDDLIRKVRELYTVLGTGSRMTAPTGAETPKLQMDRSDVNIIKMVLAIALLMVGTGHSDLATKLCDSLQGDVESKMWAAAIEVDNLHLLTLFVCVCPPY